MWRAHRGRCPPPFRASKTISFQIRVLPLCRGRRHTPSPWEIAGRHASRKHRGVRVIVTDRRGTLWAAILGSGIVFLDSSVLTVALPRISRDLPAHVVGTLEGESYLYNGYLLGESALLILAGWLTDAHGRRRIFTLGLAAFGASSLLSGFAPTLEWLIVLLVWQGVSGALIVPGSLALVTASFSGEEQGRAFGVWSGASAGVAVLGP